MPVLNVRFWRGLDSAIRHDLVLMLVIHGLLTALNLGICLFGVYDVKIVMDGEAYPAVTRWGLGISRLIADHILFILPALLPMAWLDAFVFVALRQRVSPWAGSAWTITVSVLLIAFTGLMIWGMNSQLRYFEYLLRP